MLSPVLTPAYEMSLVLFEHVTVMNIAYICCETCGDMSNFPFMREYFYVSVVRLPFLIYVKYAVLNFDMA